MATTETVDTVQIQVVEKSIETLKDRVAGMLVRNQEEYALCMGLNAEAKAVLKQIGFLFDPHIETLKRNLQVAQNLKNHHVAPTQVVVDMTKTKGEQWRTEEKRKADEEQQRLQEEENRKAREKAEEDRKAAELQAEADRKKRQKEIDQARESGALKAREADRLRKETDERARLAKEQAAKDAEEAAKNAPKVEVKTSIPRVAGTVNRTNWKFRVVDASKLPRQYLAPDEVAIGAMVRRVKDKEVAEVECQGAIEVWSEG